MMHKSAHSETALEATTTSYPSKHTAKGDSCPLEPRLGHSRRPLTLEDAVSGVVVISATCGVLSLLLGSVVAFLGWFGAVALLSYALARIVEADGPKS